MRQKKIHVIMPMAGEGKRFKDAGYDTPKPLIEFDGKYLFEHSLSVLDGVANIASYTFIVRKDMVEKYDVANKIREKYPDAMIIAVNETTRGSADTVMIAARALIQNMTADYNDSVVICDCDVKVEAEDWKYMIQSPKADGILLTFFSNDPRYSYAAVKRGKVIWTAEKDPVSDKAITSPYFFKSLGDFFDMFGQMERFMEADEEKTYKEMYMSILYNFLCTEPGKAVITVDADKVTSFGTPEELEAASALMNAT